MTLCKNPKTHKAFTVTYCLFYVLCLVYRVYLAALHYNENTGREQARSTDGRLAFTISYPRAKQDTGGYTVWKRLVHCTYSKYTYIYKPCPVVTSAVSCLLKKHWNTQGSSFIVFVLEYNQRIIDQTLRLVEEGSKDARSRYSQLMKNPGPLTLKHTKPDKATAVSTFVSRFSKSVAPVGRPEGTEDMVVEDEATKRKKSRNKYKKGKSAKRQREKGMNKNRTVDDSDQGSEVKKRSRKRKKSSRGETSQTE